LFVFSIKYYIISPDPSPSIVFLYYYIYIIFFLPLDNWFCCT